MQKRGLDCIIELVATKSYGSRPWKRFNADQVFMNVETGELEFRCSVASVTQFIWNIVFSHDKPEGEYVDVYVDMLDKKGMNVAWAHFKGNVTSASNIGDGNYVIRIKAQSDVKVSHEAANRPR